VSTLHSQIVERFLERLAQSEDFDKAVVSRLRTLFESSKKPLKADDFVNAFIVTDNVK
jgi:hypothetical protein